MSYGETTVWGLHMIPRPLISQQPLSRAKEAQDAQDLSLPASEIATDIHT
ncbi:hypothetical protein FB107DRAFT_279864 [Schizophyllum commune]